MNSTLLKPIESPYSSDVQRILDAYPKRDGYVLKLFRVFANSTRFLVKGVANLLDAGSPLSLRVREIIILRVTANLDCEYEWGVHVAAFADAAKLSEEQVRETRLGDQESRCWTAEEGLLIQVVDQLCSVGRMKGQTLRQFAETWSAEEQLEILALCGNYHTVCFVANSANLEREDFGVEFPRSET